MRTRGLGFVLAVYHQAKKPQPAQAADESDVSQVRSSLPPDRGAIQGADLWPAVRVHGGAENLCEHNMQ